LTGIGWVLLIWIIASSLNATSVAGPGTNVPVVIAAKDWIEASVCCASILVITAGPPSGIKVRATLEAMVPWL